MDIQVNFSKNIGTIKPMHCTGQPPFTGGFLTFNFSHMEYLKQAHIPYSRLHDVGGPFGGNRFVDIPNIFRDFDADETDPASYDFAFTDVLLEAMAQYDLKPMFRLGVTIENQAHIRAYRIHPPKDYAKWARICEHIVRHYNEGWANGFTYGIEYWEIWNEPDNGVKGQNQMWTGTPEQYYELYNVTAKHLKSCFGDAIKVGGYGCSGLDGIYYHPELYGEDLPLREKDDRYEKYMHRVNFFLDFVKYIHAHQSPIDFFSWHSYYDIEKMKRMDLFLHQTLCAYGYGDLERHLNEWNNAHDLSLHGTSRAGAGAAAVLCGMQDSHTDKLCYYDSRIAASPFCGFFDPMTRKPVCTYYAFRMFGELYQLGHRAECVCNGCANGLYTLAATDAPKQAIMMVNYSDTEQSIHTNIGSEFTIYRLDSDHFMERSDDIPNDFTLAANEVVLIKNYETV